MYGHGEDAVVEIYKQAGIKDKLRELGWEDEDFRAAMGGGIGGMVPVPFAPAMGGAIAAEKGRKSSAALGGAVGGTAGAYLGGPIGYPLRIVGGYYGAGEGSRMAREREKARGKTASIYVEAHKQLALSKLASAYNVDAFPSGYDEALLDAHGYEPMDKEAVLGAVGRGLAKGVTSVGKMFSKSNGAGQGVRNAATGTAKFMRANPKTTGGLALGAAGVGGAGALGGSFPAGRASKRRD